MVKPVARKGRTLGLGAVLAALLFAAVPGEEAQATHQQTDFVNWDLVDYEVRTRPESIYWSHSYYGQINYRWLDSPAKTTVISSNWCGSLAFNGKNDFPAGSPGTQYASIGSGSPSGCYRIRGRTASGSGGMYNHDGRLWW